MQCSERFEARSSFEPWSLAHTLQDLRSRLTRGSFHMLWSREKHIPGALAAFVPQPGSVPTFRLTANGGRSELCRGMHGPSEFFAGWCAFIKQAHAHEGSSFRHMANARQDVVRPA